MEQRWHFLALTVARLFHHLVVLHLLEWQKRSKNIAFLVMKKSVFTANSVIVLPTPLLCNRAVQLQHGFSRVLTDVGVDLRQLFNFFFFLEQLFSEKKKILEEKRSIARIGNHFLGTH